MTGKKVMGCFLVRGSSLLPLYRCNDSLSITFKKNPSTANAIEGGRLFIVAVVKRVVVQFIEVKKFGQGHIKGKGNFVQCLDSRIFRESAHDVVQGGLLNIAHSGKFINGDMPILAQLSYAPDIDIRIIHNHFLTVIITHLWVNMMITMENRTITRIRVDFEKKSPYNYQNNPYMGKTEDFYGGMYIFRAQGLLSLE